MASTLFSGLARGEWSSHDLRKVARTAWADLGVDYMVGEMLLNHAMKDLDATYIHTAAEGLKRQALEAWHNYLEQHGLTPLLGETYAGHENMKPTPKATDIKALSDSQYPSQGRKHNEKATAQTPIGGGDE
ncbi:MULTISPECIES: hypothetical protein [Pseudomonas syringae group]|uniref:Integrase n=2 Tax=Pseudomonas syringae group TaxID=136849 RepID=A0A3M2WYN2_PSEA0|nr:integrase family protein [Pseudomonas amygdali pv. morsprunorum str. M302280]KWS61713.1 hypothetical protein AL055_27535 [Pseudomonas amygdali pv. morsprunorum]PHN36117.1 hypothetical protein AO261_01355 [Pseudomonas avellanae]SPF20224.1 integrase family protein [Pseudomonas syringae group genomosp. 3]POC94858.1 hypothetical protein BKM26_08375 [Pseudomonas avellanae]